MKSLPLALNLEGSSEGSRGVSVRECAFMKLV